MTYTTTKTDPTEVSSITPTADLAAALFEAARRLTVSPNQTVSSDELAQLAATVVRRFLTSLEQGDLAALDDLVCTDVVYRIPGTSRISGVYEGVEGIAAACRIAPRPGARELRSDLVDLVPAASGERVATFHTMAGMLDGQPLDIDMALRFTLRDGRIATIIEYSADQYAADDLFAG